MTNKLKQFINKTEVALASAEQIQCLLLRKRAKETVEAHVACAQNSTEWIQKATGNLTSMLTSIESGLDLRDTLEDAREVLVNHLMFR